MKLFNSHIIYGVAALLFWMPSTLSQKSSAPSHQATLPRFEIASVKPSNMAERGIIGVSAEPSGRVKISHLTAQLLLFVAFDIQPERIVGGPSWKTTEQFDIEGIPPTSQDHTGPSEASINSRLSREQRLMLQALLIDRFGLRYHIAPVQGRVLELRLGKGKLRVVPSKDTAAHPFVGGNSGGVITGDGLLGHNASMALLAMTISPFLGSPVVDKTGLKGQFDFKFLYDGGSPPDASDDKSAAILNSVRGLGLDLQPSVGSIDTVVVDQLEHPTPN